MTSFPVGMEDRGGGGGVRLRRIGGQGGKGGMGGEGSVGRGGVGWGA